MPATTTHNALLMKIDFFDIDFLDIWVFLDQRDVVGDDVVAPGPRLPATPVGSSTLHFASAAAKAGCVRSIPSIPANPPPRRAAGAVPPAMGAVVVGTTTPLSARHDR
jgi:hypothetical protein